MVQTVRTIAVLGNHKMIAFEKPLALVRIFFSIQITCEEGTYCKTKISFDDPLFSSFYMLNGVAKTFEVRGEDIFQGRIWVYNMTTADMFYALTEILH